MGITLLIAQSPRRRGNSFQRTSRNVGRDGNYIVELDDELQAMVDDGSSDEEFNNELQALLHERSYNGGHRIEVKSEDELNEDFQDHDESSEDVLDYESTDDEADPVLDLSYHEHASPRTPERVLDPDDVDLPDYEFTPGRTPLDGVLPSLMPFPPRVPTGQTPLPPSPPPNLSPHTPPAREPVWRRRPRISPTWPECDSDGNPIEYYTGPESDFEDPEDELQDEESEEEPDDPSDPCRKVRRERDNAVAEVDRLRRTIVVNHDSEANLLRQANERHEQIEATLTRRLNAARQEILNLGGVVPRSPGLQELLREDSLEDDEDESDDPLYSVRRGTGAAIAEGDILIAQRNHYAQDNVLLRAEVARLQELNQAQERAMARLRFGRDNARREVHRLEEAASETSDDASEGESRPHSSEDDDADEDPCRDIRN